MTIVGRGWELLVSRSHRERRGDAWRTIGSYRVFRDGLPVDGLAGTTVEADGPGDNSAKGNRRRVIARRYPLLSHAGDRYRTFGFTETVSPEAVPGPAVRLGDTDARVAILVHAGNGFLRSEGCIHPTRALGGPANDIDFADSRSRTIALIVDLRRHAGIAIRPYDRAPIPDAWVVIEGEP